MNKTSKTYPSSSTGNRDFFYIMTLSVFTFTLEHIVYFVKSFWEALSLFFPKILYMSDYPVLNLVGEFALLK